MICCELSSFSITHSTLWIMSCYCRFTGNFWTVHSIVWVTEATFGRPFIPWKWGGLNVCSLTDPIAGAPDCIHNRTVKLLSRWDNCWNVLIQWNKLATLTLCLLFISFLRPRESYLLIIILVCIWNKFIFLKQHYWLWCKYSHLVSFSCPLILYL
jgi:hypothetical protein